MNTSPHISNNKIRQILMLSVIIILLGIIFFNLNEYLPALLGAITLYILFRGFNFKLVEERNWKRWLSATTIIFISIIVIILPLYFIIDLLVQKISDASSYAEQFQHFLEKVHLYLQEKLDINVLSKENKQKIAELAQKGSSTILNTTLNTLSTIVAMFFILYFMLVNARLFERVLVRVSPFKKSNGDKIGNKFRRLVVANAVGIPVVALGQAVVALIGYVIFGAPSPFLLFALTFFTSMIPVVGASIVYVPVGLYMMASGDTSGGIGIIAFGMIVVGSTDNIMRFTLLKKLEDTDPLTTIFGIILGLKIFGFIGLVFGPILVSITFLLMKIYGDEFADEEEETPPLVKSLGEENAEEKVEIKL